MQRKQMDALETHGWNVGYLLSIANRENSLVGELSRYSTSANRLPFHYCPHEQGKEASSSEPRKVFLTRTAKPFVEQRSVLGEDGTDRPADPVNEDVQYIQYSTVPPQFPRFRMWCYGAERHRCYSVPGPGGRCLC